MRGVDRKRWDWSNRRNGEDSDRSIRRSMCRAAREVSYLFVNQPEIDQLVKKVVDVLGQRCAQHITMHGGKFIDNHADRIGSGA